MGKKANKNAAKAGQKSVRTKPMVKSSAKKKSDGKLKVILACVGGVVVVGLIIASVVGSNMLDAARRDDAVRRYEDIAETSNELYEKFGEALGEIAVNKSYDLRDWTNDELSGIFTSCIDKYGSDGKAIYNYFVYDDIGSTDFTTKEISQKISEIEDNMAVIRSVMADTSKCTEALDEKVAAKRAEEERKAAEEAKKAAEEAAKQAEAAERAERLAKYDLTYDKFVNQIYEGMSLDELREVYTGFDNQCTISTSSSSYVFYSCKISSSPYKTASFSFRNNILTYKSQYGLK